MNWPIYSMERIVDSLLEIERIAYEMKPGDWCDRQCLERLSAVAIAAKNARVHIQTHTRFPRDFPTPDDAA